MSSKDLGLLVGLGNPGEKYSRSRHNIGFMALKEIAKQQKVSFKKQTKLKGFLAEIREEKQTLRLLMPDTFMNDSGRAIRATIDWFGLGVNQIVVLVDDMDLPLGRIRLRLQGGSGGHNGLKSTIEHLGTQNFCRLRIGIGGPPCIQEERKQKTVSHVLGKFNQAESLLVDDVLQKVILGLKLIQSSGVEKASNYLNSYQNHNDSIF